MELSLPRLPLRSALYRRLADVALLAGILLGVYAWQHAAGSLRDNDDEVFDALAIAKTARVTEHLERYLDLSASLSALFHASENVTRQEFHEHFKSLRAQDRFGALQAMQYSVRVPGACAGVPSKPPCARERGWLHPAIRSSASIQRASGRILAGHVRRAHRRQ